MAVSIMYLMQDIKPVRDNPIKYYIFLYYPINSIE